MAQAGYTPISLYYSTTASTAPTSGNLVNGELAINITDGKLYYKDNGGTVQIIASKAGASGDVVGPASATDNAVVRFDGTTGKLVQNSVVTIADSTGDISGVGQLNATTVDATNIEVTNIKAKDGTAAASIADSTGVVSITANPVLSGGTANGVLYLNGSKVATSGSALTFDGSNLLNTAGAFRSTVSTVDGIFGAGSFVSGTLGIGTVSNHPITFNVNLNEQMRLNSTGLGIGTSSPGYKLEVNGGASDAMSLFNSTNANGAHLRFAASGTVKSYIGGAPGFLGSGTADDLGIRAVGSVLFATNGSSVDMTLDASGNLGLGVTPSAWGSAPKAIEIGGNSNSAAYLAFNSSGTSQGYSYWNMYFDGTNNIVKTTGHYPAYFGLNSSGQFVWGVSSSTQTAGATASTSQALTLDASGDLLLGGTSNPGTISGRNFLMNAPSSVANKITFAINNAQTGYVYNSASELSFGYPSSGSLQFQIVSGSTVARFDSSGNLLLGGASTPTSSAGNLVMFNGTAPTGNVTNGCTLFCEDVSSSSELKVRDEAGNVTTLSPHNFSLIPEGPSEDMAWSYYSERDGKRINIDMLKAIRLLEKISGEQLVYEA